MNERQVNQQIPSATDLVYSECIPGRAHFVQVTFSDHGLSGAAQKPHSRDIATKSTVLPDNMDDRDRSFAAIHLRMAASNQAGLGMEALRMDSGLQTYRVLDAVDQTSEASCVSRSLLMEDSTPMLQCSELRLSSARPNQALPPVDQGLFRTKWRHFQDHAAPETSKRARDLIRVLHLLLGRFLNKSCINRDENSIINMKLEYFGEDEQHIEPFVFVECETEQERHIKLFFRQKQIRRLLRPPPNRDDLQQFRYWIHSVPPFLIAANDYSNHYASIRTKPGLEFQLGPLCGMPLEVDDGVLAAATLGGFIEVYTGGSESKIYGLTVRHVLHESIGLGLNRASPDWQGISSQIDEDEYAQSILEEACGFVDDEEDDYDSSFDLDISPSHCWGHITDTVVPIGEETLGDPRRPHVCRGQFIRHWPYRLHGFVGLRSLAPSLGLGII